MSKINNFHNELQKLLPETKVLLGGSYARYNFDEYSDIDFYIIPKKNSDIKKIFEKKDKIKQLKHQFLSPISPPPHKGLHIHVCLALWCQKFLYHVCGKDTEGKWIRSKISKRSLKYNLTKQILRAELLYLDTKKERYKQKACFYRKLLENKKKLDYSKDFYLEALEKDLEQSSKRLPIFPLAFPAIFFAALAFKKKKWKQGIRFLLLLDMRKAKKLLKTKNSEKISKFNAALEKNFFWWPVL